jgi:hypothetical protein
MNNLTREEYEERAVDLREDVRRADRLIGRCHNEEYLYELQRYRGIFDKLAEFYEKYARIASKSNIPREKWSPQARQALAEIIAMQEILELRSERIVACVAGEQAAMALKDAILYKPELVFRVSIAILESKILGDEAKQGERK